MQGGVITIGLLVTCEAGAYIGHPPYQQLVAGEDYVS